MNISKKIFFFFLYLFVIFLFTTLPINNEKDLINQTYIQNIRLDHIFHALLFFPWMILSTFFSAKKSFVSIRYSNVIWLLGGLLLALFTEGIQYFLKYRSFTLIDLLSNIIGLLLGWFFLPVLKASCNLLKNN